MSHKMQSTSKNSSLTGNLRLNCSRTDRIFRTPAPKKLIPSKNPPKLCADESKSCSIGAPKRSTKPKKTTKSDQSFSKTNQVSNTHDYCKNCGDVIKTTSNSKLDSTKNEDIKTLINSMNERCVRNDNSIKTDSYQPVHQYFINENFIHVADSINDIEENIKKTSLDTIREVPEATEESIYCVYTDSDSDDNTFSSEGTLSKLKEFRRQNYFECHSAKSRIKTKASATSLKDHKCVYRFYLNDRLFPVPLNADYNNKIRCIECHLPMDAKLDSSDINGTIQAKVELGGGKAQDMILMLPVKNTLIIEEKRREVKKPDEEVVYFGVIKLDSMGNSMFRSTLPENSLALKYQKGYKEFRKTEKYDYKNMNDDDVIII